MATPKKSKAKRNKNNSTGYNGVTRDSYGNFVAQIFHHGKTHRLYKGKSVIAAAQAYDKEALTQFGNKARLNFPSK